MGWPRRDRLGYAFVVALICLAFVPLGAAPAQAVPGATAVSISGTDFRIDGQVTYPGSPAEGLLLNARTVQAVFDDENPATVSMWEYPDTGRWDPERNVTEFIAALPSYAAKGLKAVTINLQGGNPVPGCSCNATHDWITTAYRSDGTLKPAWMSRLDRALTAAADNGIVVMLGLFYHGQDQRLTNEAAVLRAADEVTDWLLAEGHANVLIEIAGEANHGMTNHAIVRTRTHELMDRIQDRSGGRLLVSSGYTGSAIPPDAALAEADYVILHGNGVDASGLRSMVDQVRAKSVYAANPKPIVFNEDSTDTADLDAAVGKQASWGYHDKGNNDYVTGFQTPPIRWTINTTAKQRFFDRVEFYDDQSGNRLTAAPSSLSLSTTIGGSTVSGSVTISRSGTGTANVSLSESAPWLSITPTSGSAPLSSTLTADPTGLAAGTYSTTVTASATGFQPALVPVTFTVVDPSASTYSVLFSTSSNRSGAASLAGRTVAGNIYVFTGPDTNVSEVRFYVDDPNRTGSPSRTESNAPFDLKGGTVTAANPYDTTDLSEGSHTITAALLRTDGATEVVHASFLVDNVADPPDPGPRAPDQVHLAWVNEPSTTLDVIWRTMGVAAPSTVEYRRVGEASWATATGGLRSSGTAGTLHEVELTGLTPATEYEYRVPGDGGAWSPVFRARTAPPPGPATFEAVYVADTGLIGRTDGLATGTQQVRDEIAALDPLVVLGGGDYIYYNTDTRFGTLDNTIDAWFNQMQPIASRAPLMLAYGNHEAILGEGFTPWSQRVATPAGFDSRRNYSFDVGDVHFVAIFGVEETAGLRSGTRTWIEQDVNAAKARGQRWIVPYLHASPFADGKNHPSNTALRAELGPLFEQLGVKVVLASHDQSYERTWPLVNVPAANTPTSTDPSCYTLSDGVTWVKVSPGGKLSNQNGNFSQWNTVPKPAWTAVRDNTMHHYARLRVSAAGTLAVDIFGVRGDGSTPILQDTFRYTTGSCPARLTFDQAHVSMGVTLGGTTSAQARLSASGTGAASFAVSDDAAWLSVTPPVGSTPADLTLAVDATGLAPGVHQATVTATASGHEAATLPVTLTVTDPSASAYQLLVSSTANRASPVPLHGRTVSGNMYAFSSPGTGVTRVSFYIDDTGRARPPLRVENTAPHDLAGGSASTADPYDTRNLSDGSHALTAAVLRTDGVTEVIHATFTVANSAPTLAFSPTSVALNAQVGGPATTASATVSASTGSPAVTVAESASWLSVAPPSGSTPLGLTLTANPAGLSAGTYNTTVTASASGFPTASLPVTYTVTNPGASTYELLVSTSANRSNPVPLQGRTVSGRIYVFTSPGTGASQVSFYIDDVNRTRAPARVEKTAPHDLAGGSVTTADPYESSRLSNGSHTVTAAIVRSGGGTEVITATFTVAN